VLPSVHRGLGCILYMISVVTLTGTSLVWAKTEIEHKFITSHYFNPLNPELNPIC
jgi:hypothetical protein